MSLPGLSPYHRFMSQFPSGQTLLIDADDTLWENNIYFERAIASFISYLNHHKYTPTEVRKALNAVERETILAHGYGPHPALAVRWSPVLSGSAPSPQTKKSAGAFSDSPNPSPNKKSSFCRTLPRPSRNSSRRHRLILMTKGNQAEQADKLARSGLSSYFSAVEIVAEKNPPTYREVIHRHELAPHTSWMIGNSPKSDINPALAAGLHAVFLIHKDTWVLEHAEIDPAPQGQQLLELDSFAQLGTIF